jgi:hypothetical protein
MRLTQSSLLDLPRCHSKSGENLHQYFYDNVGNGRRKRDPCVNIKPAEESPDRLEQVDESIIARTNMLYRLIRLNVTRTRIKVARKTLTSSKIANAANTAFAGGNGYGISVRDTKMGI